MLTFKLGFNARPFSVAILINYPTPFWSRTYEQCNSIFVSIILSSISMWLCRYTIVHATDLKGIMLENALHPINWEKLANVISIRTSFGWYHWYQTKRTRLLLQSAVPTTQKNSAYFPCDFTRPLHLSSMFGLYSTVILQLFTFIMCNIDNKESKRLPYAQFYKDQSLKNHYF